MPKKLPSTPHRLRSRQTSGSLVSRGSSAARKKRATARRSTPIPFGCSGSDEDSYKSNLESKEEDDYASNPDDDDDEDNTKIPSGDNDVANGPDAASDHEEEDDECKTNKKNLIDGLCKSIHPTRTSRRIASMERMEEQQRKEVEEKLKRLHQEAEPKLTEWMDFDRRSLTCHPDDVKDALKGKRGIYAFITVEGGEIIVIKIGYIHQNDTYVDGTPLPKEKNRSLFDRLQEISREANLVCSSFCFLSTPFEEKDDLIMAETLAKFALFTQKTSDKGISRYTGMSERFELSTDLCYDIMNKLLQFIKTRHTEIMIGDKLTKVNGGDFKNNELYSYYLLKMNWRDHVHPGCCFSIAGRKGMSSQEKNTKWQSFVRNIKEPCPCITQKISQRRSRSSSETEKKQHNGTLKKKKKARQSSAGSKASVSAAPARKSPYPSGARKCPPNPNPNPNPNPGATAALQEALASAQDNDGVIETKCLNKALSFGFSKAFLDAKVEEQEELNVKPAAKKLRTEQ